MVGIFNFNTARIASQIGIMVNNFLAPCFIVIDGPPDENGNFDPPYGFWSDQYVVGFVIALICAFINFDFNGNSFSAVKRGKIIILSLMQICKDDWEQASKIFSDNINNESDLFKKGADEAAIFYFAMTEKLKDDYNNPIIDEAKLLAKERHKIYVETAKILNIELPNNVSLGPAIMELTLISYAKERYN